MGRTAVAAVVVVALLGVPGRAGAGSINVLASFGNNNGVIPVGNLVMDANGNVYGTTVDGGANGDGSVFEAVKSGSSYTVNTLVSFNYSNGQGPLSGVIMDANGNLYGTTLSGGANGYSGGGNGDGTVFEAVKSGSSYTINTLASFNGSNGQGPFAGVIMDASGNLFGTTYQGGANGDGTVFEAVKSGSSYTINTLASFNSSNGAFPQSGLIMDANGNLYGTTYQGGANGDGSVFAVVKSGSSFTLNTLASFNSSNGALPVTGLIFDASGNLYGTTLSGGANGDGTMFEASRNGSSYSISTLASFNSGNGGGPSKLIVDSSGNFYGTTGSGGTNGDGTVFAALKSGSSYTINTLASFNGSNGAGPDSSSGLITDASGNLYGTTQDGGPHSYGTLFEISASVPEPSTWVMAVVSIATVGTLAWKTRAERAARA